MKTSLQKITDVFSGADGGDCFVQLRAFLEQVEKQAKNGDESAKEILDVVYRFSRLLDVVKR